MYCPEQLSNAIGGPGFSGNHGKSIETFNDDLNDAESLQRAKSRIIAQSNTRFEQARESCKTDLLNRNLRGAINRVIEMYRKRAANPPLTASMIRC